MTEVWLKDASGNLNPRNLIQLSGIADRSGTLNVDTIYPGLIDPDAVSLILTVERGFTAFPTGGTGCVGLRVMPHGKSLSNVLDRAKTQEWVIGGMGLDVVAQDVRMPITPTGRDFFYALQSTCPSETNKMMIIDVWGYVL